MINREKTIKDSISTKQPFYCNESFEIIIPLKSIIYFSGIMYKINLKVN